MTQDKALFRFLEWDVYKDAQNVFSEILKIIHSLQPDIKFSLGNQLLRSSLSVILNIAEGSGRGTDKELNRFFDIAIGSINESVAAIDALFRNGFIHKEQFDSVLEKYESISRQLGGFKRKIRSQS